jgi:hypothetical protein
MKNGGVWRLAKLECEEAPIYVVIIPVEAILCKAAYRVWEKGDRLPVLTFLAIIAAAFVLAVLTRKAARSRRA